MSESNSSPGSNDLSSSELAGSVAFVTGAGGAIGRAIVSRLLAAGAAVAITDLSEEAAVAVAVGPSVAGSRAMAVQLDVTNRDAVDAAVAEVSSELGDVDILVNNAANTSATVNSDPLDEATWDLNFDVIVKGAVNCCRVVLPAMRQRRSGSIVNVASVNGLGFYGGAAYSAAKGALISLTGSLAVIYGPEGIRTNALAPGTIRTPAWTERVARQPNLFEHLARWYPLGRVGEPADVAETVCFLASPRSSWISGVVLPVDGGLSSGNRILCRRSRRPLVRRGRGRPRPDMEPPQHSRYLRISSVSTRCSLESSRRTGACP